MRIFLISDDESMMEFMAVVVESAIRVKRVLPKIRYRGKYGISNRKNVLNTAESTHIMRNGLSTDHITPKALRRYFSLKSFDTSEVRMNQFRRISGFDMLRNAKTFQCQFVVWDPISHRSQL